MIRKKRDRSRGKLVIDLTGPDGNAFSLMGYARSIGKQLGIDQDGIDDIIKDMMSDDYEHLLLVFDKHFGDSVILER